VFFKTIADQTSLCPHFNKEKYFPRRDRNSGFKFPLKNILSNSFSGGKLQYKQADIIRKTSNEELMLLTRGKNSAGLLVSLSASCSSKLVKS